MCRVLRYALFGALMAFPLAAAEPAAPAAESPEVSSLAIGPMATAQNKSPNCPADASYDNCSRQYNSIAFVNQKPNYVCVYVCYYTDTCYDSVCSLPFPTNTNGTLRVRSQPYEFLWGGCPEANINFCTTMEVGY